MTGHGSGLNRQLTSILYSDTMDKKAQMMDAGTALFSSEEGFPPQLVAKALPHESSPRPPEKRQVYQSADQMIASAVLNPPAFPHGACLTRLP